MYHTLQLRNNRKVILLWKLINFYPHFFYLRFLPGTHSSGVSSFSSSDSITVHPHNGTHVTYACQSGWPLKMSRFQYLGNNLIFPSTWISHLNRHHPLRSIMSSPFSDQYISSMREVCTGSLSMLTPCGLMLHSWEKWHERKGSWYLRLDAVYTFLARTQVSR